MSRRKAACAMPTVGGRLHPPKLLPGHYVCLLLQSSCNLCRGAPQGLDPGLGGPEACCICSCSTVPLTQPVILPSGACSWLPGPA
jgi:hypothetical protein